MSAPAPSFSTKRRSSPLLGGRSFMFTKCTTRRRSAKKRWALRVSWQSLKPKIWIVGAGDACTARTEDGLFEVRGAPSRPFSRVLKLLPRQPGNGGGTERVVPSAPRAPVIGSARRGQGGPTTHPELLAGLLGPVLGAAGV